VLNGNQVTNQHTLDRIKKLRIPPIWDNVEIDASENNYLQATGKDSKDRTQYIYHHKWVENARKEKFRRLSELSVKVPGLTRKLDRLLKDIDLTDKNYIIYLVIKILLKSHSRIGNDLYAEENNTFGITTLLKRHLTIVGDTITLSFIGKKGVHQRITFEDQICVNALKELIKLPGTRLFKTVDGEPIKSIDINNYVRENIGDFTSKDFRTYSSNKLFIDLLKNKTIPTNEAEAKKAVITSYSEVANQLGHTKEVAKNSYVMPIIAEKYLEDPKGFSKRTLNSFF
jgi:DNA topoisomerase-1